MKKPPPWATLLEALLKAYEDGRGPFDIGVMRFDFDRLARQAYEAGLEDANEARWQPLFEEAEETVRAFWNVSLPGEQKHRILKLRNALDDLSAQAPSVTETQENQEKRRT